MKKYLIGGILVVAVIAYVIFANRNSTPPAVMAPSGTPTTTNPTTTPTTTPPAGNPPGAGTGTSGTTTTATTTATGQYKDGTYTGAVADAFYGNLQVTVTIQGGAITNVTFPQYPQGGNSSNVSSFALPALAQEAITAQSANVNIVSGATQDSEAFQQSLASALAQAKS